MDESVVADVIARSGPIPFEEFQHQALYGPGGFFADGTVKSTAAGDFLTSPEVSPWFGRAIAHWANEVLADVEGPARIVDVGAGSGSLLASIAPLVPETLALTAVEVSPPAVERLRDLGFEVFSSLEEVPSALPEVVIANELVDNLVVAIVVRTADGWEERWVANHDGTLTFVPHPCRPEVAAWADAFGGDVPVGGLVEVQLAAYQWLTDLLARPGLRAALVIDYGETAEGLLPRRTMGTLRTYRAHHLGPDPLTAPGETDITVDVNFTALMAAADQTGATSSLTRQDDFLAAQGLRTKLSELRHAELALAREGEPIERLRTRSEATDLETLLHPRGLGDFRVLDVRPQGNHV